MKKYLVGYANVIALDTTFMNRTGLTVTATIVGEDGISLKKDDNTSIVDMAAAFDAATNKYSLAITFHPSTVVGYARIFWRAVNSGVPQILPDEYNPEEIQITSLAVGVQQQAVPIDYFLSNLIAAASKMDDDFVQAIALYPRNGLQSFLLAAQGEMEQEIKMPYFTEDVEEQHDCPFDLNFGDTFWQQQLYKRPIVSLTSWEMYHGGTLLLSIPVADVVIEKKQATIEFVPTTSSGGLLNAQLISGGDAIKLAVVGRSPASRMPSAWRIKYKAGLDFPNLPPAKKESFRLAVARKALIELLPNIDPATRTGTESESIDGISMSSSKNVDSIIKQLRQSHEQWVKSIQLEYGVGFEMVIV